MSAPRSAVAAATLLLLGLASVAAHTTSICLGQDPVNGKVRFHVTHWHGPLNAQGYLRVRVGADPNAPESLTDYPFTKAVKAGTIHGDTQGGFSGSLDTTKLRAQGYSCLDFNGGAIHDDSFWDYAEFGCCEGDSLWLFAQSPADTAILAMTEPGGLFTCPAGGIGVGIPPSVARDELDIQAASTTGVYTPNLLPPSTGYPGGGCPTTCGAERISTYVDSFSPDSTARGPRLTCAPAVPSRRACRRSRRT